MPTFRLRHCADHSSILAFSNCSSVHFAVRFKKSGHGSRWSVSLESSVEDEFPSVVVDRTRRLAFETILNIFRWTVFSRLRWSALRDQVSQPYNSVEVTTASNSFKRFFKRCLLSVNSCLCLLKAPQVFATLLPRCRDPIKAPNQIF